MQILPLVTGLRQTGLEALNAQNADEYGRQTALFSEYLGDHLRDSNVLKSNDNSSLRNTEEFAPASEPVRKDYKTEETTGAAASGGLAFAAAVPDLQKLKVTREDFSELEGPLKEHGFSQKEIDELAEKIASPDGLTWGKLVETMQEKVTGKDIVKNFSADEKLQLNSFFQKLGFNPKQSEKLIGSLERGEYKGVWEKVSSRIAAMQNDASLSVSPMEISTLAKAMNLSADGTKRLGDVFSKLGGNDLDYNGVRDALLLIKGEIKDQISAENESLKELRAIAGNVLLKAQKRAYGQENADVRQDDAARKILQSESLGDDGEQKNGSAVGKAIAQQEAEADTSIRPELKQALKDQSNQESKKAVSESESGKTAIDPKTALADKNEIDPKTAQADKNGKNANDDLKKALRDNVQAASEKNADVSGEGDAQSALADSGEKGGQERQSLQDKAWAEFWGKVGFEKGGLSGSEPGLELKSEGSLFGAEAPKTFSNLKSAFQAPAARQASYSRVAEQVQSGILKNLGQGVKQLTLQLNPENLGRLNLTLQVNNSEVKATIRAENNEAARIIADRLPQIKEQLEQQGLKVSKLEVQTSLPQDVGTSFGGAQQHNEARERQDVMTRIRNAMRMMNGESPADGISELADGSAGYAKAGNGLDIIA